MFVGDNIKFFFEFGVSGEEKSSVIYIQQLQMINGDVAEILKWYVDAHNIFYIDFTSPL
jgi:hypothetical protein